MRRKGNRGLIGGLILVVVGILAFANQFNSNLWNGSFGAYLLLGLGVIFLIAGILTREDGWFIPGGILTGLGAGVAVTSSSWVSRLPGNESGWFLIFFAAGWFLIPILTALFGEKAHWWALIPGGIIGLMGVATTFGGDFWGSMRWVGMLWPLILIGIGVSLFLRSRHTSPEESEKPVEKHA